MNNATLREAMARGGVIELSVRIDYVDEVAAGTRYNASALRGQIGGRLRVCLRLADITLWLAA